MAFDVRVILNSINNNEPTLMAQNVYNNRQAIIALGDVVNEMVETNKEIVETLPLIQEAIEKLKESADSDAIDGGDY